jgi:hypothetical protein
MRHQVESRRDDSWPPCCLSTSRVGYFERPSVIRRPLECISHLQIREDLELAVDKMRISSVVESDVHCSRVPLLLKSIISSQQPFFLPPQRISSLSVHRYITCISSDSAASVTCLTCTQYNLVCFLLTHPLLHHMLRLCDSRSSHDSCMTFSYMTRVLVV